ncbi:sperm-associated antigen 1 [Rhinophrynus dorsalis]
MSAQEVSSLMDHGTTKTYQIPIGHLDYSFISKCLDVKYLEKILFVLRSGEEGLYPDLTEFCEKRIQSLSPNSRALRKDKPPATAADFSLEEWQHIDKDIKKNKKTSVNKTVPRDYKDWDRFDVEKELSKIDVGSEKKELSKTIINSKTSNINKTIDTAGISPEQRNIFANNEKDKGNEAFRCGDYKEAVIYYSRSISVLPSAAAYNNRAQAEIKLKNWENAMNDCERVLDLDPGNIKAFLRRATIHKNLCNYQAAVTDLRIVLRHEPDNPMAKKTLAEVNELLQKAEEETRKKGKKIVIQEIEGSDEEDEGESHYKQEAGVTVGGGGKTAGEPSEMGNAQKKFSPKRNSQKHEECQTPKQNTKPSTQNGVRKDCSNGGRPESKHEHGGSLHRETDSLPKTTDMRSKGETEEVKQSPLSLPAAARLKTEGNQLFKNGQFGEAVIKYSEAIENIKNTGSENAEELAVLYSNRAACHLKDGNCRECIEDCNRALELQPFSIKPLLRRAMANESLERYRPAYVDYKTALQIDSGMQLANDSINRITKTLIEQDGPNWREKLPPIPSVPVSIQVQRHDGNGPSARIEHSANQGEKKPTEQITGKAAEERFLSLKQEGNEYVKKGQYREAEEKYTACLKLNSEECSIYTNRALCYLKLSQYEEARQDCDCALQRDALNIKALYRRAQAYKGLKNYQDCAQDLQKVMSIDPGIAEAKKLLDEIIPLLTAADRHEKQRRKIPIEEVEEKCETIENFNERESVSNHDGHVNHVPLAASAKSQITKPTNAYEFGQLMNEIKAGKDKDACAELLSAIEPKDLPVFLSNKLEGDALVFIIQSMKQSLLDNNPNLVYQHLLHLSKAERFQVMVMLLNKKEKDEVQSLLESLSEQQCIDSEDLANLAKQYEL